MVRSTTTTEPEWDAQSYALIAALADWEASLCPRCSEPLSECMDPLADRDNPAGTHRYVGRNAGRCHACDAIAVARKEFDNPDVVRPESYHFRVDRVTRSQRPTRGG